MFCHFDIKGDYNFTFRNKLSARVRYVNIDLCTCYIYVYIIYLYLFHFLKDLTAPAAAPARFLNCIRCMRLMYVNYSANRTKA